MEKVRYMISDAANLVDVESHVLRYWEDELELNIPRNEMGHRYYTKENIQEFQKIKELKEQGYQLKAIRMIVHNGTLDPQEADFVTASLPVSAGVPHQTPSEFVAAQEKRQPTPVMSNPDKMAQFEQLMSSIIKKAIAENNDELSKSIGEEVSEQVLKEMNYLAREQEEAQEARFRQLDSAIRGNLRKKERKLPRFRMNTEPKTT
ncbi:MAG: MerR family transcriptional regulator [Roseburia sp.]